MADDLNPILDLIQKENVSHDIDRSPSLVPSQKINDTPTPINKTVKVSAPKEEVKPTVLTINEKVDRMRKISSQIKKAKQKPPTKHIVELW